MTDTTENRSATWGNRLQRLPLGPVTLLVVVLHFSFLMVFFEPAISTPDAHGYFAQARLMAQEGTTFLKPQSLVQYLGPHWYPAQDDQYVTTFPPGLPALLAVGFRLLGPTAALVVNPLLASLTLLGLFLLCRAWLGEKWALLAVLLMAVNPFANEHALFGDAHAALSFFFVWSLVFLAAWTRTDSICWAFGTGLCAGVIPSIRYPESVLCLGLALFALRHLGPARRQPACAHAQAGRAGGRLSVRSLLFAGAGAAIPLGALLLRNQAAFGAFWKTGYDLMNEPTLFGWHFCKDHCAAYLLKLLTEGCGLTFVLGVAGMTVLAIERETRPAGILLAALTVPLTVLYMSYFWPPDPQSMRYLLPTFYIYAMASVWLLKRVLANHRPWSVLVPVLLLMVSTAWGLPVSILKLNHLREQNAVMSRIASLIDSRVERGSVLVAGEVVNQHLDFLGRWRLVDGQIVNNDPSSNPGRLPPAGPLLGPPHRGLRNVDAVAKFKDLTGRERFQVFAQEVWHWAGRQHRVYLLGVPEQVNWFKTQLPAHEELVAVAELKLPDWRTRDFMAKNAARPPRDQAKGHPPPDGPMGPAHIFDLPLHGESLLLVEWRRTRRQASASPILVTSTWSVCPRELGSTRAFACSDLRRAGRNRSGIQSRNGSPWDRTRAVGEGADHGTRGRVRLCA